MKIQIEPKKDTSNEKFTYISYEEYQTAIPKAPNDVRLSDVKDFIQKQSADLEYYSRQRTTKETSLKLRLPMMINPFHCLKERLMSKLS